MKRAIGAGKRDIIAQSFAEGIIVMAGNIIVSVLLVLDIAAVYKFVRRDVFHNQRTIYIAPYSVLIFLFSAVFLSLSYSLIFAYQSTRVEIVKHLKAE